MYQLKIIKCLCDRLISESQERMLIVCKPENKDRF